jgi:hypothetical protein
MTRLSLPTSIAILLALSSTSWALECPVVAPDPIVAQILPADTDLEAPEAIQSAVFELKQAGIADDAIVDQLISVYCGSVAALPDVSDDEKDRRVEAFSQMASDAVFGDVD